MVSDDLSMPGALRQWCLIKFYLAAAPEMATIFQFVPVI